MGITRIVETDVECNVCGKWIIGWKSVTGGVSKEWAKYHARKMGAAVTDEKVVCKECRIKIRMHKCSLIKKMGQVRFDNGKCLGFANPENELCEKCKRCIAYTDFDWEDYPKTKPTQHGIL